MIFYESDLKFNFSNKHWRIKKYDTHRYYKILSSAGLKGVDFLGLFQTDTIIFFEVKNYRNPTATKPPTYLLFDDTDAFIDHISHKLEDTTTAINVIIQYLQKKPWFRFFLKWKRFIPTFLIKNRDWYFWYLINEKRKLSDNKILILWLETDVVLTEEKRKALITTIDKKLESNLNGLVDRVEIPHKKQPLFKPHLIVS
jgi:hypothetical protein